MAESIRAFIALDIPDNVKAEVERARAPLRAELPRARWVRMESQHLTLKFLGEVSKRVVDELAEDLVPRLAGVGAVDIRFAGAGFFPSEKRPRVAWIGGEADGVDGVAAVVERVARSHGFPRERRRWTLHLTQARIDRPWPSGAVAAYLRWGEELELSPFRVAEVVLYSSRLEPGGAVYTALERIPLE